MEYLDGYFGLNCSTRKIPLFLRMTDIMTAFSICFYHGCLKSIRAVTRFAMPSELIFRSEPQHMTECYQDEMALENAKEWWGMNDQIKLEAKEIGEMGQFVTLVPDLYRGKVATDREEAGHLMSGLDWPGAVKDIQGAAKYLLENGCTKVGVTGFCMGGALTLAGAALVPELSAAAPFYGIPSSDLCDVSKISIPVQAHFGEEDALKGFSSKEDALALQEKMKGNSNFELFLYKGCGHAFTNKTGPLGNYREKECNEALSRMTEFMKKWLA